MNGIKLETLMAAHETLMRVWRADYAKPVDSQLQSDCMRAAVGVRVELQRLGLMVEVKTDAAEQAPDERLRAVA